MKTIVATTFFLAGVVLWAQAPSAVSVTGTITGTLTDNTSAQVAAADVSAFLQTTSPGQKPLAFNAYSANDGSFVFTQVPPGKYLLCVEKRSANLLNPCIWGPNTTTVTVPANGGTVSAGTLSAERGVLLQVRVNDPSGLIANSAAKDDIFIGTSHGNSPFIPATLLSRDAGGKTMIILVREAVSASVSVYSKNFKLGDSTGAAFSAPGVQLPVTPSATASTSPGSVLGSPAPGSPVSPPGVPAASDLTISVVSVAATN